MSKIKAFDAILKKATKRKNGEKELKKLMPTTLSAKKLAKIGDDRFLSMMTKCINQAGFSWKVIENKWPQFEEAFYQFNIHKLLYLSPEEWDNYITDTRVVRHGQKIETVYKNAYFIHEIAQEHGCFAKFIADWPSSDQVGLMLYLKKNGARLGGNTGQYFLRRMGKDSFILSEDVVFALQNAGVETKERPSSQKDLKNIQAAFNQWHEETQMPYSHLSKIASYSVGTNYENDKIKQEMEKYN